MHAHDSDCICKIVERTWYKKLAVALVHDSYMTMSFAERSANPFGVRRVIENLLEFYMNSGYRRVYSMAIPTNDKFMNIEITCHRKVDCIDTELIETVIRIQNDQPLRLKIRPKVQFTIDIDFENRCTQHKLHLDSHEPTSLESRDMDYIVCHIMTLLKSTTCIECGEITVTPTKMCASCLSKTTANDFEKDAVTERCGICLEGMDVPIMRKRTNCCSQLIHKRCCAEAVINNRNHENDRLKCPYCRSREFDNTTYTLEVDDYKSEDEDGYTSEDEDD